MRRCAAVDAMGRGVRRAGDLVDGRPRRVHYAGGCLRKRQLVAAVRGIGH